MSNERILRKLKLKDEYEHLKQVLIEGKQSIEEDAQASKRMDAIRREAASLEAKRPSGRPRVRAIGAPRPPRLMGTPNQQAEARGIRKAIAAAKKQLEDCKRRFAHLAGRGGPSR
jgi:hypothetical protein